MCLCHGEVREQQKTSKSTGSEAEIFLACQHAGAVRTLTTHCGKDGGREGRGGGGSSGQAWNSGVLGTSRHLHTEKQLFCMKSSISLN